MLVEHKGFIITQAYNHHIHVYTVDDGRFVMHAQCSVELSEDELRDFFESHFYK